MVWEREQFRCIFKNLRRINSNFLYNCCIFHVYIKATLTSFMQEFFVKWLHWWFCLFFCGVHLDHVEISLKASYMSISALQTLSTQTDPTVVLPRTEEKELSSKDMLFWIILSKTNYYKYLKKEDTLFYIALSGMTCFESHLFFLCADLTLNAAHRSSFFLILLQDVVWQIKHITVNSAGAQLSVLLPPLPPLVSVWCRRTLLRPPLHCDTTSDRSSCSENHECQIMVHVVH